MAPDYDAIFDDMGGAFMAAYERAAPFTMTSRERMYALWQSARYIARAEIPGDIVECGVWRGGSSMLAALALLDIGVTRPLWLFDTYEGMPEPSARDRQWSGERAADRLAVQERVPGASNDWAFATLEDVRLQMASLDYASDPINFVKGQVEDTVPQRCPGKISLLRLDTDWYQSTLHELEHLCRG